MLFKAHTASVFELDLSQSLEFNLNQQLLKLSTGFKSACRVEHCSWFMAEHREAAGEFFKQYLLPRREATRELIQLAIQRGEIRAEYPFELMLDMLYGPIHYQIIFFNTQPDEDYIQATWCSWHSNPIFTDTKATRSSEASDLDEPLNIRHQPMEQVFYFLSVSITCFYLAITLRC